MAKKATPKKRVAKKNLKPEDLQDLLLDLQDKERELYESNGISRRFVIAFPNHKKMPILGRFAIKLINALDGDIRVHFGVKQ